MVRPREPGPVQHRRVDLPDRADRGGGAPHRRGHRSGHRDLPRSGCPDPPARRRHLAVRADRRRGGGRRHQQISRSGDRLRRRVAPRHGSARHRARPPQFVAQAEGALLSRRRVAGQPGHDRRHDRQQLVRLALHPLRQHGAQRARDQRDSRGRDRGPVRRGVGQSRGIHGRRSLLRSDPAHARAWRPRSRRDRAPFPGAAQTGRRVQHRHPRARPYRRRRDRWRDRRRERRHERRRERRRERRPQHGPPAGRDPRARWDSSPKSSSTCSRCRPTACSGCVTSQRSTRRCPRRSTS